MSNHTLRWLKPAPPAAAPAPLRLPVETRPPALPQAPPPILQPPPARPLPLSSLPAHLAPLVQAAARGELPRGPVFLASGLVLDLSGYVLAWASGWPSDEAHTLRRLEEAYTVWGRV